MLGPEMPPPRRTLGLWVATLIVLVALVLIAYPDRARSSVPDGYLTLEGAPIPVQVIGWIQPLQADAQLSQGGYTLHLQANGLGDLTISGSRDASALPPGGMTWQAAGVSYAIQTTAQPDLVRSRVTSLETATAQLTGSTLDTPLLYLFYLPAFAAVAGWLSVSLLRRP
jgi:hypothetical protein